MNPGEIRYIRFVLTSQYLIEMEEGGGIQKPTGSIIKAAHNLKIFVMSASVTPENQIEELLLEDKRVTYLQIFQ